MQEYSPSFYSFSQGNVVVDRLNQCTWRQSIGMEYCTKCVKKYRRKPVQISVINDETLSWQRPWKVFGGNTVLGLGLGNEGQILGLGLRFWKLSLL